MTTQPPLQSPPPINPPPFGQGPTPPSPDDRDERMWAMFCHLSTFAGYMVPFGNIIGPLIIWMTKRETMPLVADQGKEALNFQITVLIALILSLILTIASCGVLFILPIAVGIFSVVLTIIAAIKANEGQLYRYPMTMRLIN